MTAMGTLDKLQQLAHWPLVARVRVGLLCFLAAELLFLVVILLFREFSTPTTLNEPTAALLVQVLLFSFLGTAALIGASFRVERLSPESPIFAAIVAGLISIVATFIFVLLGIFSAFAWAAMIAVAAFGFTVFDKRFVWSVLGIIICGLAVYSILLVMGSVDYHELLYLGAPASRESLGRWLLFQWSTTGIAGVFAIWFIGVILEKWHAREGALQYESETDALTELLNRRSFFRRCADLLAHPSRADQPVSVALFDLDHFKLINDHHGHDAGDATLVEVARTICRVVREDDLVARFGGEEIVVVLPGCNLPRACDILERCRLAIANLTIHGANADNEFHVTTSIGLTCAPNYSHEEIETLIQHADEALYQAKSGGRNRIVVWGE